MDFKYKSLDLKLMGKRIELVRGLQTQTAFAGKLKITKQEISRLENGKVVNPSPELLLNICNSADPPLDMKWLLTGEGKQLGYDFGLGFVRETGEGLRSSRVDPSDYIYMPVYDVKGPAGGGPAIESEQITDHIAFKKTFIKNTLGLDEKDLVLISAAGESMVPAIHDGDLLLLDMRDNFFSVDGIYCIRHARESSLMVKRVQRVHNGTMIKSDNPAYDSYTILKGEMIDMEIIGRVVWAGRKL